MTKRREPETPAVRDAKAHLRTYVQDLEALRGRVLAVVHGLRSAAATAPVVATLTNGKDLTSEGWIADVLESEAREELGEVIRLFALDAREDPRPAIRKWARDDRWCEARDKAKDQGPAPVGEQTVAEANRAAIVAALQREGIQVHQTEGRMVATVKLAL